MINSRDVVELALPARRICLEHIRGCKAAGIELLITSTYRDPESQNALYAIGRTKDLHLKTVTKARGGQSWHQYRCAWDDEDPVWKEVVRIGKAVGAESASEWKTNRELAHFQVRPEPTFTIEQALNRFKEMGTIFL